MFDIVVLLIAIFTAMASAIVGVFLVLRKMSMMTDAISHTVLLGIVLVYIFVKDLSSPLLVIGATLMGLFTTYLIELLIKTKTTTEDAATGVVFPLLFSIAVIIISLGFRGVHLDIDAVLTGNLEWAGTSSLYIMIAVFIINLLFFFIFYKELKIVSFDAALASVLGISPIIIHYLLMGLVSLTAVTAFDAVGSILVIALMIGPASTALLFTKNLLKTTLVAMTIGVANSIIGYLIALYLDISIAGVIASMTLVVFLVALFFNPKKGVITTIIKRNNQQKDFAVITLMVHIKNHQKTQKAQIETSLDHIYKELNWSKKYFNKRFNKALEKKYIVAKENILRLSEIGETYLEEKLNYYSIKY